MTWWADGVEGRDATSQLLDLARANRAGEPVGIYSVCSANRSVLRAAMAQAQRDGVIVLIEATTNQVNQFGGYTGMTPPEFRVFVHSIAAEIGLPSPRIVLGGDHLGPYVWRSQGSDAAMARARDLVRDFVLAGFTKIHLDASMRLADDPVGPATRRDDGRPACGRPVRRRRSSAGTLCPPTPRDRSTWWGARSPSRAASWRIRPPRR